MAIASRRFYHFLGLWGVHVNTRNEDLDDMVLDDVHFNFSRAAESSQCLGDRTEMLVILQFLVQARSSDLLLSLIDYKAR